MIEDDFYATIKLKSGEEVFAKISCSEEDDRTFLLLANPIIIQKIKSRAGMSGYKVEPWIKTSKEDLFIINMDDVMTLIESDDLETITMHQTFANQQHSYFERKTKLDRKMGYISTINEAKEALEKLFKDN
tara:strand:+ start:196 stop:588 length:393 start_codon:yes stop_codon:yes gene_type:complete